MPSFLHHKAYPENDFLVIWPKNKTKLFAVA